MRYDEGGTCLLICAWCAGGGLEINGHAGGARHGTIGALRAAHAYPLDTLKYWRNIADGDLVRQITEPRP